MSVEIFDEIQTNEEWLIIEEFPRYSVSNFGRVKNNETNYILIGGHDKDGYNQVTLCYNGKQYNRRVCRLVAKAFIDNPNNLPFVNHKDENKTNDNANNLEWCTIRYNNNYGKHYYNVRKRIKCVETDKEYISTREVERQLGFSHTNVGRAARMGNLSYGFHWKYINE